MRSDFLVHWTGKDLSGTPIARRDLKTLGHNRTALYNERLWSVLSKGFWMTRPVEQIHGGQGSSLGYRTPTVCFTEIKLSQAFEHAQRYGLLGLAVDRRFVLERHGGPVHYVRNHFDESIILRVAQVGQMVQDSRVGSQGVFDAFAYLSSFYKAMSATDEDDFALLDEHEWRIAHTPGQEEKGRIEKVSHPPPEYRVPLDPSDLRFIVFPNEECRALAASDPRINDWFAALSSPPVWLTLEECGHF